jgi:hypothetical protein
MGNGFLWGRGCGNWVNLNSITIGNHHVLLEQDQWILHIILRIGNGNSNRYNTGHEPTDNLYGLCYGWQQHFFGQYHHIEHKWTFRNDSLAIIDQQHYVYQCGFFISNLYNSGFKHNNLLQGKGVGKHMQIQL